MIEQCNIRAFEHQDISRLHEIRAAAYAPVFKSFRSIVGKRIAAVALANAEREQGEIPDEICEQDSAHEVFVVEHGTEIVAFCSITCSQKTKVGVIDLNAVHPDCQGKGVGTPAAIQVMRPPAEPMQKPASGLEFQTSICTRNSKVPNVSLLRLL